MSFKEVNTLRKNGDIDQAYTIAEQDFRSEPNKWSASALFWVLNDQCKSLLESNGTDAINSKIEEMNTLFQLIDDSEGFAQRSLESLRRKANPENKNILAAIQLSKDNHHQQAADQLRQIYQKGNLPDSYHEAYGWTIYRYLQTGLEKMDSRTIRGLLHDYIQLCNARPSQLHSLIMTQALRTAALHEDFKLIPFFRMWGLNNLIAEDWLPVQKENQTYPARAQKILDRLYDAAKSARFSDVEDLLPFFAEASRKLSDSKFAKRKYGLMLAATGHKEDAYKLYLELIKNLNEWYVWHEIAMLCNDPAMRLSCLCKALSMNRNEDFIGELRLHAAETFLTLGHSDEAKRELYHYDKNREEKKWARSEVFKKLERKLTIPAQLTRKYTDYLQFTNACEELIYQDLPLHQLILVSIYKDKEEKTKCRLTDKTGEILVVVPQKRYPELRQASEYDAFLCRIHKDTVGAKSFYKALTLRKADPAISTQKPYYIQNGAVVYFNKEKQLYKIILQKDLYCYIPLNQIKENWQIGDTISVDFVFRKEYREDNEIKKINVIRAVKNHTDTSSFVQEVKGELKVIEKNEGSTNRSFGFINNCYIPTDLLKPYLHLKGSTLKGKALSDGDKWQIFQLIPE